MPDDNRQTSRNSVEKMPEMDFYIRENKRDNVKSQYSLKTEQVCPTRVSLTNSIWIS